MKALALIFPLLISLSTWGQVLSPWLDGSDQIRFAKYLAISKKVEAVVNSDAFRARVQGMKFTSTKKTPDEILAIMQVGSETMTPDPNFIWDWGVGFYYKKNTKVIGYTQANWKTVWVNTAKFDVFSDADIAANIAHEYMHKIGFDHASARDYSSVPYAVGYLVRDMVKEGLGPTPPPKPENPAPEPTPAPRPRCGWWCRLTSIFK